MNERCAVLDMPRHRIGEVAFRVAPLDQAVTGLIDEAGTAALIGRGVAVHFANAYTIALAEQDARYSALLSHDGSAVFTDGMPVAWVGRRAWPSMAERWERVYGPDVMQAVLAGSDERGPRHYLLGGSPETLDLLLRGIALRWPLARIVGAESPPYDLPSPADLAERDARIAASGATMVWVGLGTPKQDWEAARLATSLPVVALAVGAAFDFLAGTKPQAPLWMQRSGMEWAHRLASEPRRLAHRYLWGNPRFLAAAARQPGLRPGSGERTERMLVSGLAGREG